MTTFAVSIWAWQETGKATALALAGFFGFGPTILLSPFAGAIVDRYNRKLVMMLSDLGAGLATIALLILYTSGRLEVWHIYLANAFAGAFAAFQFPAYSAAVSTMMEKKHYGRASGMLSLADSASGIFAPLLAGALIGLIGIGGIMNYRDALEFLIVGARAVQVGTANFVNPRTALNIVEDLERYCIDNGIASINDIIGTLDLPPWK
jgi:MFS family permease